MGHLPHPRIAVFVFVRQLELARITLLITKRAVATINIAAGGRSTAEVDFATCNMQHPSPPHTKHKHTDMRADAQTSPPNCKLKS